MGSIGGLMNLDTIKSIVARTADATLLHNNANKASERIPVMRDFVAGEVAKHIALTEILPKEVADAHISGDIHYHDLDYSPFFPSYNCMLIDVRGMLEGGFRMGNADVTTPKSITVATTVTAQIIAQVASHIYGGCTVNRIDEVLAPYVKASYNYWYALFSRVCDTDAKAAIEARLQTEKETRDAFKGLEYEINTLHTANGQAPFVTLGFGLGTSWESRLIQQSILSTRIKGLGRHKRTAVFPKLVFAIKDGVNHKQGDINYDIKQLALECASKRMYPDIINVEKLTEITGGFKTPMGCRSFLHESDGTHDGRNNLGVVSINLPRIAIEAKGDYQEFWRILQLRLQLSKSALDTRIARFEGVTADVAPILYTEGACGIRLKPTDEIMQLFTDGRASISLGYIGLEETANALFTGRPHTFDSAEKQSFCHAVLAKLKEATTEWTKSSGFAFSLYSTPSESLCDRFCRLDADKFGEIETVTDKGYYTNSFHLDVFKKVSPNQKIDFEVGYAEIASGGFISYCELPNMKNHLSALEWVWDYTFDKLGYFGTNTPVDYCGECDFAGETVATANGFTCPSCGNHNPETLQVTRRVCGYLGAPNARPFIEGKQKEVIGRIKHHGG